MTDVVLRRAEFTDAAELAAVSRAAFTEAFGHLYPPADLRVFLDSAYSLERTQAYLVDPRAAAWMLWSGAAPVGYALVGSCDLPHPDVTRDCDEIKRIYLRDGWKGQGHGGVLMQTALAWLEREGPRRLWLGVWSQNLSAQALYARHGFRKVGEYRFAVGETRDHEFIMRRG